MIICLGFKYKGEKTVMLELHPIWFLVLLINFLGLLVILNWILFKPLVKLFSDREDATTGAIAEAKDLEKRREEAMSTMNRDLRNARNRAKEIFEEMRKDGIDKQKEILEGANKQALGLIEEAKTELKAEIEKARQKMRSDVERFSDEIVRKLVAA